MSISKLLERSVVLAVLLLIVENVGAQNLLQKYVSVSANNMPLDDVLKNIGKQAGFSFSYNNNVIAGKRPVSLNANSITVANALDELLKGSCTFKQVGNHILLQASKDKFYNVTGYVLDANSGLGVPEASVYERQQLVATITDNEGFFKLRLRHRYPGADISISKEFYKDTIVYFAHVEDKPYRLPVRTAVPTLLDEVVVIDNPRKRFLERYLNKLFLSGNLRTQTKNITRFIAERPVQASFVPGVGSHGKLGAHVVNKFSFNILGGYTAGVNGVEIAGLFNIDRGDVEHVQAAGLFNLVGANVSGVQVAGLTNTVQDSVSGVQVAGISNYAGDYVNGIQVSGITNVAMDSANGVQISGIVSLAKSTIQGAQISGLANAAKEVGGVQIGGIVNYAGKLHGAQIGLINLADSSFGSSIGLINISRNGYHKLAFYADEVVLMNTSLKSGTPKLYTILFSGFNPGDKDKAFSFGAGLGHQSLFTKKWSLTTEATIQHLYLGDWDHSRILYRIRPGICYQATPWLSFLGGPSLSIYQSDVSPNAVDYIQNPANRGFGQFKLDNKTNGWLGWQIGFAFF
jgi:hypothetical protein